MLFSETTGLFLTKFCMQAFRYMEMEIYQYAAAHMTKMAAMPIYGKNPSKIFYFVVVVVVVGKSCLC